MTAKALKKRIIRYLRGGLLLAAVLAGFWLVISFGVAWRLSRRLEPPYPEPAPDVAWADFQSHRITTSDSQEIGAWYHEGCTHQPVVLLLHGYSHDRSNCLDRAEFLARRGCSLLLISLRAHGDSTGEINDIGYSARLDVIAAVDWIEKKTPGRKIIVFGISLGSAAAIFASPCLGKRVHGYIWETPYRDLHTAVRNRTENYLPPVLSQVAYTGLCMTAPVVLPHADEIAPVRTASDVPKEIPVLILAGLRDRHSRIEEAVEICGQVNGHAALEVFEKAGHCDVYFSDPLRYQRVVLDFVHMISNGRLPPAPNSSL